jgi:hypothetical protein
MDMELRLEEEYGLRMFKNKTLIKIFERKGVGATGGWHNEVIHNSYESPNICT